MNTDRRFENRLTFLSHIGEAHKLLFIPMIHITISFCVFMTFAIVFYFTILDNPLCEESSRFLYIIFIVRSTTCAILFASILCCFYLFLPDGVRSGFLTIMILIFQILLLDVIFIIIADPANICYPMLQCVVLYIIFTIGSFIFVTIAMTCFYCRKNTRVIPLSN